MRPSEEVALELYKKYGPGSNEAIIGFTFDLGEISDPVYGTAKNLRGEFPFALAPGELTLPEVYGQPATLQKYAEELLPHCREAFPYLLDDEIIAILKDYGIVCTLCPDNFDANMVKGFILIMAFIWIFDDLIDSDGPDDSQMSTCKSLESFVVYVASKAQQNSDEIWNMVPSLNASLEGAKQIAKLGFSYMEQRAPKFINALTGSPFQAEARLSFQSNFSMKEVARQGKQYSKTTLFELYRCACGNRMGPEMTLAFYRLEIPPEIRSDILFQSALNNFADITCFYNAILGLPRDVRKKEDSPVTYLVTVQKKSLQEAFDEIYSAITDAFNDYMINTNKLLEVYDDPSLKKYVESMNSYMAGTLIGYKCMARYGVQAKMNVVTMCNAT